MTSAIADDSSVPMMSGTPELRPGRWRTPFVVVIVP